MGDDPGLGIADYVRSGAQLSWDSRDRPGDPRSGGFASEYRFELHPRFQLAAFYEVGRVSGGLAAGSAAGWLTSWGGGVRVLGRDAVQLRLDVARGGEGTQVHLGFGYAF